MIKLEVIDNFTLERYERLKNVKRKIGVGAPGRYEIGDTFETDEKTAKYLMGENPKNAIVVKVIEIPGPKEEKQGKKRGDK